MTQGLRAPGRCKAPWMRATDDPVRAGASGGARSVTSCPSAHLLHLETSLGARGVLRKHPSRRGITRENVPPAKGSRREDPVGTRTGTHGHDLQGPGAHGATACFLPPLGWGVPARGAPFHRGDPDHTLRCGRMPRGTRAPCARNGPACGLRPRWARQEARGSWPLVGPPWARDTEPGGPRMRHLRGGGRITKERLPSSCCGARRSILEGVRMGGDLTGRCVLRVLHEPLTISRV